MLLNGLYSDAHRRKINEDKKHETTIYQTPGNIPEVRKNNRVGCQPAIAYGEKDLWKEYVVNTE